MRLRGTQPPDLPRKKEEALGQFDDELLKQLRRIDSKLERIAKALEESLQGQRTNVCGVCGEPGGRHAGWCTALRSLGGEPT
jgi:hypothetical protein